MTYELSLGVGSRMQLWTMSSALRGRGRPRDIKAAECNLRMVELYARSSLIAEDAHLAVRRRRDRNRAAVSQVFGERVGANAGSFGTPRVDSLEADLQ